MKKSDMRQLHTESAGKSGGRFPQAWGAADQAAARADEGSDNEAIALAPQ